MVRRRLDGWKIGKIAEALQVSEKTVDRWCSIHRKYGGRVCELDLGRHTRTGRLRMRLLS